MIDLLFINICSVHGVHPKTIEAIILHESSFNESALNINTRGISPKGFAPLPVEGPKSKVTLAEKLYASKVNFDAGLMQVNSFNFKAYGISVKDAFDPCKNIRVGSEILKRFYDRAERDLGSGQDALKAALSAYNTGNSRAGFENGYVAKFYGKKVIHKENPFRASMVPLDSTVSDTPKKEKSPYTISMIPTQEIEGEKDAETK